MFNFPGLRDESIPLSADYETLHRRFRVSLDAVVQDFADFVEIQPVVQHNHRSS